MGTLFPRLILYQQFVLEELAGITFHFFLPGNRSPSSSYLYPRDRFLFGSFGKGMDVQRVVNVNMTSITFPLFVLHP